MSCQSLALNSPALQACPAHAFHVPGRLSIFQNCMLPMLWMECVMMRCTMPMQSAIEILTFILHECVRFHKHCQSTTHSTRNVRTTPRSMMTRCLAGRFLFWLLPNSSSGLPILAASPLNSLPDVEASSSPSARPSATYHLHMTSALTYYIDSSRPVPGTLMCTCEHTDHEASFCLFRSCCAAVLG